MLTRIRRRSKRRSTSTSASDARQRQVKCSVWRYLRLFSSYFFFFFFGLGLPVKQRLAISEAFLRRIVCAGAHVRFFFLFSFWLRVACEAVSGDI
jgi:hypothetical protein